MKPEDKLLDLYGISQAEAVYYWHDKLYTEVLKDKIEKAKKLQGKLMNMSMLKKDTARIKRIGDDIAANSNLLREVRK